MTSEAPQPRPEAPAPTAPADGGAPRPPAPMAPRGPRPSYGGGRPSYGGGGGDRGGSGGPGGPRRPRRKVCSFCVDKVQKIDYKDVGRIRRYISERGKIDPRRKSGSCAKHQRMLTTALKRARFMALLPTPRITCAASCRRRRVRWPVARRRRSRSAARGGRPVSSAPRATSVPQVSSARLHGRSFPCRVPRHRKVVHRCRRARPLPHRKPHRSPRPRRVAPKAKRRAPSRALGRRTGRRQEERDR